MVTRESGFGQRYKQLPYLDDYGLSEEVVKEYIDKKASIYKKWNERLDEKNMTEVSQVNKYQLACL